MLTRTKDLNNLVSLKSGMPFGKNMKFGNDKPIKKNKIIVSSNKNNSSTKSTEEEITKGLLQEFADVKYNNSNLNAISQSGKRILIIIATHSDKEIRKEAMRTNLPYFKCIPNADIVVVNSSGLLDNTDPLRELYRQNQVLYMEVPNSNTYDFGKWDQVLSVDQYCVYDYYVFTNDSYFLSSNINHFFNLIVSKETEFFGYTDCSEHRYHIQSYLFSIKREAIPKFITLYDSKKRFIRNQTDVINHLEIYLCDAFASRDCFLKVAYAPGNCGKNFFYENDTLYNKAKEYQLMPFTKIKRLLKKR